MFRESKEGACHQADGHRLGDTPLWKGKVPKMVNTLITLPGVNEIFEGIWVPRLQINTHLSTGRWWFPVKYLLESVLSSGYKTHPRGTFVEGATEYQEWLFAFGPLKEPIKQTIQVLNEEHGEYFKILNDLASVHPIMSFHPLFITTRQLLLFLEEKKLGRRKQFGRMLEWLNDEVITRYGEEVAPVKPKPPKVNPWDGHI